ncbi:hypothetical protein BGX38DRAFT_1279077 [Terfezia claveryi]|nr:hypothetical protein BGX38DRAFT_1279077 [Terfezia claveryi]
MPTQLVSEVSVGNHSHSRQDERLVGSQQPEHLQTRGQHHEIALAVHIKNIYTDLGGTTIATLSPSSEAFHAEDKAVFGEGEFRYGAQDFTTQLNLGGAAWVNGILPIPPTISPALPPPPPTPVTETSTQTTPLTPAQKPTTNSVSTNTDHPPAFTYAEAATGSVKKQVVKSREKIAPPPESQKGKAPPETRGKGKGRLSPPPTLAKTMVLHAAPTKFKPGQMRRWIEEDNKSTGVQILGIRWLTQEHRRAGKMASSLVIYMKERINIDQGLRMGRRFFRTTVYDWSR